MDDRTFHKFRDFVYERSGISLKDGKKALVEARIGNRMRALGITEAKDYLNYVTSGQDLGGEEIVSMLDAISTNVTFFFREVDHFHFLQTVAEKLIHESQVKTLKVWSAACSTGEEPYTIGMVLSEAMKGRKDIDCRILATDLSTRVLKESMTAVYPLSRMENVPPEYLSRYFVQHRESEREEPSRTCYEVREDIRKMVSFARVNLSTPPFPMQGPFDFIFCRNVMIYFDDAVRERLVSDMVRLLRPGGFLLVGHSETLTHLSCGIKVIRPSIYRKEA